ncbi:GMC oxidoreductase [Hoyosella subflava]|uniref:Cholesterol oxidase n=1 Tax=Hoyosella subflava (strain DSM 45089 / JCM 17490 / NBRC 109087 / DQS3-9A1) TaxID=443218 RepID=F6ES15_HOYSD|nr:GMC family oxidoreductase [Hoyosella subflava]AEF40830.1 FAD dependent oxidoreductase [Hoyosella subflava DQS3-9A1]
MTFDYDVLVIGSGFGGSVAALRLTEKGYRVGVLEAGRRFDRDTLPKTSWDLRNFLWAPKLRCFGMQRIHMVKDAVILAASGVGGGSLVYANTLYEPLDPFFRDKQWSHITDWRSELSPYYRQAKSMLGVQTNPDVTAADEVMKQVAEEMGVGDTYHSTPVGVCFGGPATRPGESVGDPYFGGAGPERHACIRCGECMTGCKYNAKNTLDKNYLHLAERNGAEVRPLTTVTAVRPLSEGGYAVDTVRTGRSTHRRKNLATFTAEQVIFAAGTYNTQKLLHRLRDEGALPEVSPRLGELTRTNSESILGAKSRSATNDYTRGVAITSSFHPDEHTHIEPVRYGKGSNAMGLLQTALTDGGEKIPRWLTWVLTMILSPRNLTWFSVRRWSEKTIILLVMQTLDNSINIRGKKGLFGTYRLTSSQGHGAPNPTWIPKGNETARRVSKKIGGVPGGTIGEIANIPMTAHFIGGCPIGDSRDTGVIDPWHRIYGHPGLHVTDGSAITANLGVNPSLTITAQAERALAFWPNKGQADSRPPVGSGYTRLPAVAPQHPAVPEHAPAALHLPIADVTHGRALTATPGPNAEKELS